MDKNLQQFIDFILERSGLDKMPADFLDEYSAKLIEEAQKRLSVVAVKELDKDQIDHINALAKNGGEPGEIAAYLQASIPDYEKKMTIALQQFGEEVIDNAKKLNL